MAIKLIATDMDDTLLGPQGKLSPRTKAALSEAMRRGVKLVLASGRMPQAMSETARELGVNGPVIAYNGGLITDLETGRTIKSWPVPQELAREAAAIAEELGGHVQVYQNGAYSFAQDNDYARAYGDSIGLYGHAAGKAISEWFTGEADKLLIIGQPEQISRWVVQMQAHFGKRLSCAISRPNYIEVFRAGVDKSAALKELAARYGIGPDEIAAFGDGENDLGMVGYAGHGYIMANARPGVKQRAANIAPSNAEDGLAQVVEGWLANGQIPEQNEETGCTGGRNDDQSR